MKLFTTICRIFVHFANLNVEMLKKKKIELARKIEKENIIKREKYLFTKSSIHTLHTYTNTYTPKPMSH